MSMRVLELADVARRIAKPYGIEVVEHAGWQTRGKPFGTRPDGAVEHWTVGPATGVHPSLRILINGRSDLPGPLCNISQDRQPSTRLDRIHIIAAGVANHAGYGEWNGIGPGGNSLMLGNEIEWSGPNEAFSAKRSLVADVIMAIMIECTLGKKAADGCEHREWCLPEGRKIDTNRVASSMRSRVHLILNPPAPKPPEPKPEPEPTPAPPEDDEVAQHVLFYKSAKVPGTHAYKVTNGVGKHLDLPGLELCRALGVDEGLGLFGGTAGKPLDDVWIGSVVLADGPLQNVNGGPLDRTP